MLWALRLDYEDALEILAILGVYLALVIAFVFLLVDTIKLAITFAQEAKASTRTLHHRIQGCSGYHALDEPSCACFNLIGNSSHILSPIKALKNLALNLRISSPVLNVECDSL